MIERGKRNTKGRLEESRGGGDGRRKDEEKCI